VATRGKIKPGRLRPIAETVIQLDHGDNGGWTGKLWPWTSAAESAAQKPDDSGH